MRLFIKILPILMLTVITAFVSFVFNDYMIEHGLNPREAMLISILAIVCYALGILVMMANRACNR